jgi:hypothetical protein
VLRLAVWRRSGCSAKGDGDIRCYSKELASAHDGQEHPRGAGERDMETKDRALPQTHQITHASRTGNHRQAPAYGKPHHLFPDRSRTGGDWPRAKARASPQTKQDDRHSCSSNPVS